MNVVQGELQGTLILEPKVFGDERGFFMESFNEKVFTEICGERINFVQDNHSRSTRGVLRGMHYQVQQAQGKLVRVVSGSVYDVAVDMRKSSPTFGKWMGVELTAENKRQFWIPAGFAHGFVVLSETADFLYKASDYYAPQYERCLSWNDPTVGIVWPLEGIEPQLSGKDKLGLPLGQCETYR
jgi:dTDP-4-dehydrorhamnose 3,5-epimerase